MSEQYIDSIMHGATIKATNVLQIFSSNDFIKHHAIKFYVSEVRNRLCIPSNLPQFPHPCYQALDHVSFLPSTTNHMRFRTPNIVHIST